MPNLKRDDVERISDTSFNIHCGKKIRNRRLQLKKTQTWLANKIQKTFQQVQKYEKGTNGCSSIRLMEIANALKVPTCYFFDGFNINNYTSNLKYEDRFPEINRCNQVRNERLYPNPNSYGVMTDHLNLPTMLAVKTGQENL